MNTISSSSSYSVSASTNNGFSGMVSGMDTEGLVKKMLSGTQSKIDKQNGLKQVAQWKQEFYRETISSINKFKSKFMDFTSDTNLMSNSFYNKMKATTTSTAFRVTGSSNAIVGNTSVSIQQLASNTKIDGVSLGAGNLLKGEFNTDAFKASVSFEVKTGENSAETITLDETAIKTLIKDTTTPVYGKDKDGKEVKNISFTVKDCNLTIKSDNANSKITVKSSTGKVDGTTALGLEKLGLRGGMVSSDKGIIESTVNEEAKPTLDVTLDGIKKTIELEVGETKTTLQDKLDFAFGTNTVKATVTTKKVDGKDVNVYSLTTTQGRKIVVGGSSSGLETMGFKAGQSNTVAMGYALGDVFNITGDETFKINDKEITVSKDDTISEFMKKINTSDADVTIQYSELENKFVMSRNSSGAGFDIKVEDSSNKILNAVFGGNLGATAGKNSKVTINGVSTERSTNNFTINGLNFELLEKTTQEETITTTRNTDDIFDGIKSFVEEYNTLIKGLNSLVDAKSDYKDYPPLTDDQRKEMSESEIKAWEKKAKTGLLGGDNDISSFLSQMRLALYKKPDSAKYALYDIGIETSKDWKERGKLEIDEDKLRKMISADPTAIQELFTYSETKIDDNGNKIPDGNQGIAVSFNTIIKATANTSSGSPGTLVSLAGVSGFATDKDNILSDQMNKMTDKIKSLKVAYEKEKTRYWRQFNEMEKVLANLSAQSGWLTQQFGG